MQTATSMVTAEFDPGVFRKTLGNVPTSVSVVTSLDHAGALVGMVVGTFTSVSLEPALVGFLPSKQSRTWQQIEATGRFCVNVLGHDQFALCKQMAGNHQGRFSNVEYSLRESLFPVLTGSIASFCCNLHSVLDAGDHVFVLGEVSDMQVARDVAPLVFFRGVYRSLAATV
jgi:3-hydroxy-9,10-secoandrosta-1,3,5(10)-triene-9,17-dione monooxygenase reductase component